jgi:hypothetical protein
MWAVTNVTSSFALRVAGIKFSKVHVPETSPVPAVNGNVTAGAGYAVPLATAVLHSVNVYASVPVHPVYEILAKMV